MKTNKKNALIVTIFFCSISALLIYGAEGLLHGFANTPERITRLAAYKEIFFVLTTSLFLYLALYFSSKGESRQSPSFLEAINDAVFIYNPDTTTIIEANQKAHELFPYGNIDFQTELVNGQQNRRNAPLEWFKKTADQSENSFEWETVHPDGRPIWLQVRIQKIEVNGAPRLIAVARDISESKRSENSLKRFNRTLRMLLTCNDVLTKAQNEKELFERICKIVVEDGFFRFAWVGLAGNHPDKKVIPTAHAGVVCGSSIMTDISWKEAERGKGPTGTAIREGLPCLIRDVRNDIRFLPWKEDAVRHGYVSVLSVPLIYSDNVFGALTVGSSESHAFDDEEIALMRQLAEDIAYGIASLRTASEGKLMEYALVKSEKNLAEAQAIASLGSWEYDLVADEEYRSDEFFRILGLTPSADGRAPDSVFDYIHPDDKDTVLNRITETLEEGSPYNVEYRIIRADGSERTLHAQGKTLNDDAGKAIKFIGTAIDITERKKALSALLASELRFRSLVEATTDWIWEVDENLVYVYSSPKIRDLLGYEPEEIIGKTPFHLMHPQEAHRLTRTFRHVKEAKKPFNAIENINLHKNGNLVTIETSGVPFFDENEKFCGYRGIDRDVSDRKKLEEKYLQAQKMEAVGQLAGGVAHDFNNILTAIIGFEHLLMDSLDNEKTRHYARQVLSLADKASNLTRDLLAFSRKQTIHPKQIDINETIRKIGKILKRLIGEDIHLQISLDDGTLPVLAVTGHMEQVFMNLATNSRDAMPNGGLLTITTEIAEIDNSFTLPHGHAKAGKYALISFSDTGIGMDEVTRQRVFEPFFSTKEVGKGTGLGLSTAYGIIHQHEGFISVYSESGEGTTFRIYLPLVNAKGDGKPHDGKEHRPPGGKETVLLAEDEPPVREVMSSLLIKNGYQVIIATDGEHALNQYLEYEEVVDLLILDVIMPKKNGKEVYDIISKTREDIKTLFISGYTADIVGQKGIPETCHLMTKPFSPDSFLWKIRDILDEASENSGASRFDLPGKA